MRQRIELLERLAALRQSGALTEAEFLSAKAEVIAPVMRSAGLMSKGTSVVSEDAPPPSHTHSEIENVRREIEPRLAASKPEEELLLSVQWETKQEAIADNETALGADPHSVGEVEESKEQYESHTDASKLKRYGVTAILVIAVWLTTQWLYRPSNSEVTQQDLSLLCHDQEGYELYCLGKFIIGEGVVTGYDTLNKWVSLRSEVGTTYLHMRPDTSEIPNGRKVRFSGYLGDWNKQAENGVRSLKRAVIVNYLNTTEQASELPIIQTLNDNLGRSESLPSLSCKSAMGIVAVASCGIHVEQTADRYGRYDNGADLSVRTMGWRKSLADASSTPNCLSALSEGEAASWAGQPDVERAMQTGLGKSTATDLCIAAARRHMDSWCLNNNLCSN